MLDQSVQPWLRHDQPAGLAHARTGSARPVPGAAHVHVLGMTSEPGPDPPRRHRRLARGVRRPRAGRGRPRRRPDRAPSRPGSRTRAHRRAARAERDGRVDRRRGRRPVVADGAAQDASTSAASSSTPTSARARATSCTANPHCSLLFPWHPLERQVRIEGTRERGRRRPRPTPTSRPGRAARSSAPGHRRSREVVSGRDFLDDRYALGDRPLRGRRRRPAPAALGRLPGAAAPDRVLAGPARADARPDPLRPADETTWNVERLAP